MAIKKQPRVFVYGTLKPGGYYWARYCEGRIVGAEPARVAGELFSLPLGYPAMVTGEGWVKGYLLTLKDDAVLAGLDSLEGYAPGRPAEQNEYQRIETGVFREDGESLGRAWTYIMRREQVIRLHGALIEGGDWDVDDTDTLITIP